jgi:hypothetical protein
MFVRKLRSKQGKVYVQVIDKSSGGYKVKKTIGSSFDEKEIEELVHQGNEWITIAS